MGRNCISRIFTLDLFLTTDPGQTPAAALAAAPPPVAAPPAIASAGRATTEDLQPGARRMVAIFDYDPRESSPNTDIEVRYVHSVWPGLTLSEWISQDRPHWLTGFPLLRRS